MTRLLPSFAQDHNWVLRLSETPSYAGRAVWFDPTDGYEYDLKDGITDGRDPWVQIDPATNRQRLVRPDSGLPCALPCTYGHTWNWAPIPAPTVTPITTNNTPDDIAARAAATFVEHFTDGTPVRLRAPSPMLRFSPGTEPVGWVWQRVPQWEGYWHIRLKLPAGCECATALAFGHEEATLSGAAIQIREHASNLEPLDD